MAKRVPTPRPRPHIEDISDMSDSDMHNPNHDWDHSARESAHEAGTNLMKGVARYPSLYEASIDSDISAAKDVSDSVPRRKK